MSHDKLKEILIRRLKLEDPYFRLEGRGRVSGSVVSATFAGKGDSQRQRMIWDALDKELGPASVKEVGMLLAYTPEEWDLPLEGTVVRGTLRGAKPKSHKQAS
jgi:acid stress-induced BolA-like protein IbaG/YrbA